MALSSRVVGSMAGADLGIQCGPSRVVASEPKRASCEMGYSSTSGAVELHRLPASLLVKPSQRGSGALKASLRIAGFQSRSLEGSAIGAILPRRSTKVSRSPSVSLRDSDSELSPPAEVQATDTSSKDYFETDRTPAGSNKGLSLAEQLSPNEEATESPDAAVSIASRPERSSKSNSVDRWAPEGSMLNHVKDIVQRLADIEETDEAVQAALEGWDSTLSPRDIASIIPSLRWRTAVSFFKWVQSQGYEVNVVVYNVLLGAFRTGKAWKEADKFAKQMISDGIELDNFSYSTLISCAVQCDVPEEALVWFDRMKEQGVVPDEVTYSNMALVYSKLDRVQDAIALYDRLRDIGWKPDKIGYGTMINVFCRSGDVYRAEFMMEEMEEDGMPADAVEYNTIIGAFNKGGKTIQAKRAFARMQASGIKPTQTTYSLMIDVHGRAFENKEAFQMFTRMKEDKCPLDVVVYNSLLKMCAEMRLVNEAENILAGMVGRGIKPDMITYRAIVSLYAKESRIKDAEKFANILVEKGFSPDVVIYSGLIKACSKDVKRAAEFFERMSADGIQADDKCCGVLLSTMTFCSTDEDRALIMDCLRRSKPVLCEVLDALLAETFELTEVEEKLKKALDESEPDSRKPFCNAFTDVLWGMGKKSRAQQFMTLAESLKIYEPYGLRTRTFRTWILHCRGLSFMAAQCALQSWVNYLRVEVVEGRKLPDNLVLETGVGRGKDDVARLYTVLLDKLKQIGAPFGPHPERADWLLASGPETEKWLLSIRTKAASRT